MAKKFSITESGYSNVEVVTWLKSPPVVNIFLAILQEFRNNFRNNSIHVQIY